EPDPPARIMPFSTTTPSSHENTKTRNSSEAESFSIVASRLYALAPIAMLDVPPHRVAQAVFERMPRRPAELAADFRGIDRVAPIVPRPIGNECPQFATTRRRWCKSIDRVANPIDDLEVGAFVAAADIVLFAQPALCQHQ